VKYKHTQIFLGLIVVLALAAGIGISCGGSSTNLRDDSTMTESIELIEATNNIEEAFISSDIQALQNYIDPDTFEFYETAITENSQLLPGFQVIFGTRQLVAIDAIRAVYEVTYENKKYEITMTLGEDGIWRLKDF